MDRQRLERISTKHMTREDWVLSRKDGIGGSDAAAIMGLNAWATPYSVWADKTGRVPPKPDTETMRQGRDLEEYVSRRWQEATGKKARRKTAILKNFNYPWAHANVDRWVEGENAGLECKTTSTLNLKKFKDGEFPDTYYCQCMHYMAVTGADRWYLAVVVLGREFLTFVLDRDDAEIDALMATERYFWETYVKQDKEPPVDGLDPTSDAVRSVYKDAEDTTADLMGLEDAIKNIQICNDQIKRLKAQAEKSRQLIETTLGASTRGVARGYEVDWKPQTRRTFQVSAFIQDHPEMDLEHYYKTSEFRKFSVKEVKDDDK